MSEHPASKKRLGTLRGTNSGSALPFLGVIHSHAWRLSGRAIPAKFDSMWLTTKSNNVFVPECQLPLRRVVVEPDRDRRIIDLQEIFSAIKGDRGDDSVAPPLDPQIAQPDMAVVRIPNERIARRQLDSITLPVTYKYDALARV
jgi:hypothetical protein